MRIIFYLLILLSPLSTFAQEMPVNKVSEEKPRYFPIWGEEAKKRGYTLPRPYGVNVSRIEHDEKFGVDKATLNGEDLFAALPVTGDVKVDTETKINMIRTDFWLLPFFNLYLGLGQIHSNVQLEFKTQLPIVGAQQHKIPFKAKGTVANLGGVLVAGYNNWFAMTNFNLTDVIIEDELDVNLYSIAFRGGYNAGKLQIFTGAMYIDSNIQITGSRQDIILNVSLSSSGWHGLAGLNYEINREFGLTTELSFGDRYMYLLEFGYRF
ncbi:hypothetical protein ABMA79_03260 [Halobacteriovorax sp. HFRX-2_2]|uniref:hypothetical protein n=1 Tax=unclassified Halobacteriovorax TaxID=2639665 RepID=UPI00372152D1